MSGGESIADFYEEGIRLFNEERFFECHEAWEEAWKRGAGDEKLYYQGMIQAAVAILHVRRGNIEGARSLYDKARAKLDPLPAEYAGIALGEFRDAIAKFFAAAFGDEERRLLPVPRLRRLGGKIR